MIDLACAGVLHFCDGDGASSLRKSMSKSCQSLVNQNHRLGVRANVRRLKRGAEMKGKYSSATASHASAVPPLRDAGGPPGSLRSAGASSDSPENCP